MNPRISAIKMAAPTDPPIIATRFLLPSTLELKAGKPEPESGDPGVEGWPNADGELVGDVGPDAADIAIAFPSGVPVALAPTDVEEA
jgi:hypothetical protein